MSEGLICGKQVAAMLGVSHQTFSDWRRKKRSRPVPPGYFINGRYRYDRAEVEAWIRQHPRTRE